MSNIILKYSNSAIAYELISSIFEYRKFWFRNSSLFKIAQLIITIVSMTTFYAPIKYLLMKFMDIEQEEREKND